MKGRCIEENKKHTGEGGVLLQVPVRHYIQEVQL